MAPWTLAEHGDAPERAWAPVIANGFPNYERFWALHVVPLTYRIFDPSNILVRGAVTSELELMATSSYATFSHLVACHETLRSAGQVLAPRDVYTFYSRLYSARDAAGKFLAAVKDVLRTYGGVCIPDKARWLKYRGKPGLARRWNQLDTRTEDYRGQQVHDWGFLTIGAKIPRREYLSRWIGKGMGEIDRLRTDAKVEEIIGREFVDGLDQAREDLRFVEGVLDDVWEMAIRELDGLTEGARYRADQRAPGNASAVGAEGVLRINLSSQSASGTWGAQGAQGPQGPL